MTYSASTRGLPRYYVVRETLRREISERMKPGDRLPTESELVKRMGVSRITVRHALEQLRAEGLIVRVQGRGTFVSTYPSVHPNLQAFSSFVADISASGQVAKTNVIRVKSLRGPTAGHTRLGVAERDSLVCVEKIRLANGDPISFETTYILEEFGRNWTKKDLEESALFDLLAAQGVRLARGKVDIAAVASDSRVAKYIGLNKGAPLLQVTRLIYTEQNRLIEYDVLSYRSDRVRYSFEARSESIRFKYDFSLAQNF